jgi:hypothetical protein
MSTSWRFTKLEMNLYRETNSIEGICELSFCEGLSKEITHDILNAGLPRVSRKN